jgi:glycosyltransferase involved in cell wall biosynthesis
MRVLQALTTGGTGGTERMVASLVERLPAHGIDPEVSLLVGDGEVADTIGALGIPVHHLEGERSYRTAVARLAALFAARRFDVAHLYGFRMSLVARAAAIRAGVRPRLVHGIRGLHLGDWEDATSAKTRLAVWLERAGGRWIDLYAANSPDAVAFLTARGLPAAKFRVIPNGLDVAYWSPDPGIPRLPDTLVAVANLRPVKRMALLIEAAALLARQRPARLRLVVVGEGPLRPALEAQIRALGAGDVVHLAGALPRDDVRSLLRTATACVLTSSWEGMPVSLLEAMACGCPVIGTDVPGIRALVDDGRTGLLATGTAEAVAAACGRVLDDDGLRGRLGLAARAEVEQRFSLDRMAASHASLYRMVLE